MVANRQSSDIQHVVGYGWKDGVPVLHLFDQPSRLVRGAFAIKPLDERRCIGWWDRARKERNACRNSAPTKKAQCIECSRHEGFWQCMTCDGFSCPPLNSAVQEYCRADHILYLACFGTERIKIGTSSASRGTDRLTEQGPVAAAVIARGPGPIIRQMETLGVQAGLAETVTRTQKFNAWRHAVSKATAHAQVHDTARLYCDALPDVYSPHLHAPIDIVLPDHIAPTKAFASVSLEPLVPGALIKGDVIHARGHLVILHDGAGQIAIDLASLKGRVVDFSPADGPPPVRQLGLF